MKTFLVLYQVDTSESTMSVQEMIETTVPEQMVSGMARWLAWQQKCGDALLDLGAPLGGALNISATGAAEAATGNTGYSILRAPSIQDAASLMEEHPHFHMPGSAIQIMELIPMPGM